MEPLQQPHTMKKLMKIAIRNDGYMPGIMYSAKLPPQD